MYEMFCILKVRFRNQFNFSQLNDQNKMLRTHARITASGYVLMFVLMLSYVVGLVYQMEISNEIEMFHQYLFSLLFWVFGIWTLLSGVKNTFISSDMKQIAILPLQLWQTRLLNIIFRLILYIGVTLIVVFISQICIYIYHPFTITHIVVLLCYIVAIPLAAMLLTIVIALVIHFLFVVLKIKSVISEAITVLAIFLTPLLYAYIQENKVDMKSGFIETSLVRSSLIGAVERSTLLFALLFLLCVCVVFLIVSFILVRYYATFEALFFEKGITKKIHLKVKDKTRMLVQKEIAQYKSSFTYVSNTILGPAILLVVSSLLLFGVMPSFPMISMYQFAISNNTIYYVLFIACIGLTTTTACSFSIEGRKIWILRSLPLTILDLSIGKGMINVLLFLPGIFISVLDCIVVFGFKGIDLFGYILLLCAYLLSITSVGLYVNLKFPQYDWINEMVVVKQSGAVIMTAMLSLALLTLTLAIIVIYGTVGIYVLGGFEILITLLLLRNIKQMKYLL